MVSFRARLLPAIAIVVAGRQAGRFGIWSVTYPVVGGVGYPAFEVVLVEFQQNP